MAQFDWPKTKREAAGTLAWRAAERRRVSEDKPNIRGAARETDTHRVPKLGHGAFLEVTACCGKRPESTPSPSDRLLLGFRLLGLLAHLRRCFLTWNNQNPLAHQAQQVLTAGRARGTRGTAERTFLDLHTHHNSSTRGNVYNSPSEYIT